LTIGILPIVCNPVIAMDPPERTKIVNEIQSRIIQAAKANDLAVFRTQALYYPGSLHDIRENGHNLLHIAAIHNAFNIVQHLVDRCGFNIQQPTNAKDFAIDLAKREGHVTIVDYLARAYALQEKKAAAQAEAALWDELVEDFLKTLPSTEIKTNETVKALPAT